MEDVVILILFTYPGVFAEYIYHQLATKKSFLKKPDDVFRVARDFFISAFVTMCALSVLNWCLKANHSISTLVDLLKTGDHLWRYCGISLLLSIIAGFIWYGLEWLWFCLKNARREKKHGTTISIQKRMWDDFLHMKGVPLAGCVLAIYKDGNLIHAGMLKEITLDPADDPGILLMFTETVEHEMRKPPAEWKHVGGSVINYYDMNTGTKYAIHDGKDMQEYIDSLTKE